MRWEGKACWTKGEDDREERVSMIEEEEKRRERNKGRYGEGREEKERRARTRTKRGETRVARRSKRVVGVYYQPKKKETKSV